MNEKSGKTPDSTDDPTRLQAGGAPNRQAARNRPGTANPPRRPVEGFQAKWMIVTNAVVALVLAALLMGAIYIAKRTLQTLRHMNATFQTESQLNERLLRRLPVSSGAGAEDRPTEDAGHLDTRLSELEKEVRELRAVVSEGEQSGGKGAAAKEIRELEKKIARQQEKLQQRISETNKAVTSFYSENRARIAALENRLQSGTPAASESGGRRPVTGNREYGKVYVETRPEDARVIILNSKEDFRQGVELRAGRYQLEVSAPGHRSERVWVDVEPGGKTSEKVVLKSRVSEG
jgi:hypothetical protein